MAMRLQLEKTAQVFAITASLLLMSGVASAGATPTPTPTPAEGDFTLVALPDTQYYVSSLNGGLPAMFTSQTDWIAANSSIRNIAYVAQLGDCVQNGDNGGNNAEWLEATNALYRLENPNTTFMPDGIPYGVAVGNHDQSPSGSATGTTTTTSSPVLAWASGLLQANQNRRAIVVSHWIINAGFNATFSTQGQAIY